MIDYVSRLIPLVKLCRAVGTFICECYEDSEDMELSTKPDHTPVTKVDLEAHSRLSAGLIEMFPRMPVLSEESGREELRDRLTWARCWMLDPLDGTREFLNKTGDFTINIALIERGRPILGVIHQPLIDVCYVGWVGVGAWCFSGGESTGDAVAVATRSAGPSKITVLSSRGNSGLDFDKYCNWLREKCLAVDQIKCGAAVKFIKLVDGTADLYPRFSVCSEWDVAAGDAIVHAAGGSVLGLDGLPLRYNCRSNLVSEPFIAVGDPNFQVWSLSLDMMPF